MMRKHLMIGIDWFGPYYSFESARKAARGYIGGGLYLCIGKTHGQKKRRIQYVGIGNNTSVRLNGQHHKISDITRETEVWLGEVVTPEPSGRRTKFTRTSLDIAEWLLIYFLQPELNDKKTRMPPQRNATVMNRWWKTDEETLRRRRPHAYWPDLIDYMYDYDPRDGGRRVWFSSEIGCHK